MNRHFSIQGMPAYHFLRRSTGDPEMERWEREIVLWKLHPSTRVVWVEAKDEIPGDTIRRFLKEKYPENHCDWYCECWSTKPLSEWFYFYYRPIPRPLDDTVVMKIRAIRPRGRVTNPNDGRLKANRERRREALR